MAMSPYYVQYLLTQGDLFGRILSFNADFAAKQRTLRQQDPSTITDSLYRLHPELARFHEEHNISYYFERPVDRYCLLKNDELDRLIIYLGACISAQQLARITEQSELDQVYEEIGREVYNFALDYGYLIKNFDYEPNLAALKQDCSYLGLCALKGLSVLFSSQELGAYFTDKLIAYTKERKLNPSIITAHTHVLSPVDTPATLMKAPAPEVMNTPVQYAPIDAHPARNPAQALSTKDKAKGLDDPVMKGPALTNADLAQRRLELESKRQGKKVNPTPFEHIKGPTFGVIGGTKVVAMSDGVNAYLIDSDEDRAHIEATLAQYTPEQLEAMTHHQPKPDEAPSAVLSALEAQQANPPAAAPTAEPTAESAPAAEPVPESAPAAEPVPASAPAAAAPAVEHVAGPAPLDTAPLDYAQTALYAGINTKERRAFRAASRRQHEAFNELVAPPERPREALEHETLVTLDFSPNQVLELSTLILESQINECWYEYLCP